MSASVRLFDAVFAASFLARHPDHQLHCCRASGRSRAAEARTLAASRRLVLKRCVSDSEV
eukprot:2803744-Rhodomonas_salina.3